LYLIKCGMINDISSEIYCCLKDLHWEFKYSCHYINFPEVIALVYGISYFATLRPLFISGAGRNFRLFKYLMKSAAINENIHCCWLLAHLYSMTMYRISRISSSQSSSPQEWEAKYVFSKLNRYFSVMFSRSQLNSCSSFN